MKHRKWVFPVSLCVLAAYAALYAGAGEAWIRPRKAALAVQLSTSLTGFMPKMVLAVAILCLTLAFGRWYCRLLCPAGIVQELFSRIGAKLRVRRLRHAPVPPQEKTLLLLFVGLTSAVGIRALAQLTDPVGLFGRLAMPLAQTWRYFFGDEATLPAPGQTLVWGVMIAGAAMLIVLPLFKGRLFCDRFCPVGALLGATARVLKIRRNIAIDKDACVSCGQCGAVCPVQCADPKGKTIEADRCLGCGACAPVCAFGAIGAQPRAAAAEKRRSFIATMGAAAVFFVSRPVSALFAADSPAPQIAPPGTGGDTRHRQYCIGCQACVAACPMGILQVNDSSGLRPVLNYDLGFCHYNCRSCLDSCPAHAFRHFRTLEERQRIRVARVALDLPRCVALLNNTACGACAEVCPTHALQMREQAGGGDKPTIPDFDPSYCIGCGACYHACPAEPRAFIVQGLAVHETAEGIRPSLAPENGTPPRALPEPGDLTDFPF